MIAFLLSFSLSSSIFYENGRLRVTSKKVTNVNGSVINLRGVSTSIQDANVVTQLSDAFQAKVIRITYDGKNINSVEAMIKEAKFLGVYVIVSTLGTPVAAASTFLTGIAKTYGGLGNVLYEVGHVDADALSTAIRGADAKALIVIGGLETMDSLKAASTRNGASATEAYGIKATTATNGATLRTSLDSAALPIIISDLDGSGDLTEFAAWTAWADSKTIGIIASSLAQSGPAAILTAAADFTFVFKDSDFTPYGRAVHDWLRAAYQKTSPYPPTPPATVSANMDRLQMNWQLGVHFNRPDKVSFYNRFILPKLIESGSDVRFTGQGSGNWAWTAGTSTLGAGFGPQVTITETGGGLFNNYIFEWEPAGSYFTGVDFYGKDGIIGDPSDWATRRAKVYKDVVKFYGVIPDAANALKITWTKGSVSTGTANNIPYRSYTLTGTFDTSGYPGLRNIPRITGTVRTPASVTANCPIIVLIGGYLDSDLWAAVAPLGMGIFIYDNTALQPDYGSGLTSYIIGLASKGAWRNPSDWGALAAWGWGISKLIDYWTTDPTINEKRVAVTGHSRYGKAAAVTLAYDDGVFCGFPSSSGAFGLSPSRRHWGEDLENCAADDGGYYWAAGNAIKYVGVDDSSTDGYLPRRVSRMNVDAEHFLALVAPRPVFVGCGNQLAGDPWVDPYGMYLTAARAGKVWDALGKKGLVMNDTINYKGKVVPYPTRTKDYIDGDVAYRQHNDGHMAGPNYPAFTTFMKRYL
jgi:hypothetical protein